MAVFTISDLHLSFGCEKPMDIFGNAWQNHPENLEANWRNTVTENDTVVLPGDHSWGLKLSEAVCDLKFIESLPGNKILLKGNHDLWWPTAKKLEEMKRKNGIKTVSFLNASAVRIENAVEEGRDAIILGTRGWLCPGDKDFTSADSAIFRRECIRLETAFKAAARLQDEAESEGKTAEMLCFIHYPPFGTQHLSNECTAIIEKYGNVRCFYGHLHGVRPDDPGYCPEKYTLVSCDHLGFKPLKIT